MGEEKMNDEMAHEKNDLNKNAYSVRVSQAVLQYGVGAMVDFPDQTLMTAAPEIWKSCVKQIHDERLEKALHVDYFGMPDGTDGGRISYVRFPEWYFCPKCRKFKPIDVWVDDYKKIPKKNESDPFMVRKLRCSECKQELVVARIVTVCEHGHIDDFPWVKWVHCRSIGGALDICAHPKLSFKTNNSSEEGLEGLLVECSCGAKTSLSQAFDPKIFKKMDQKFPGRYNFLCTGRHPWKNFREKCEAHPRTMQRGGSAVYYPAIASSLVIPPYSSQLTSKIEASSAYLEQRKGLQAILRNEAFSQEVKEQAINAVIKDAVDEIQLEIGSGWQKKDIESILERKWKYNAKEEYSTYSIRYRAEEYEALGGYVSLASERGGDFLREPMDVEQYHLPYIKQISLIHKVREVQALTGFSRVDPAYDSELADKQGRLVSIKEKKTNWYPAYEVRGEGIFIEFDSDAINQWRTQNSELNRRVGILNKSYRESYIGSHNPRSIEGKFLLLHTISHLLIKQLSFECGYSIASLKERIYCANESDGKEMSGIFIYTASGDSEGTLGGLVRQGRPDTFPTIFKKAIESGMVCSNDPVCSLSSGQGRDALNLAACYSCGLLPETSCEEHNVFLDRGTVVGVLGNKELGFFYKQLYSESGWNSLDATERLSPGSNPLSEKCTIIPGNGIDLSDEKYCSIWDNVKKWATEPTEKKLLDNLISHSQEFEIKEKPILDCAFVISNSMEQHKATILWKKSKVVYFTADDEDDYNAAKASDWVCFSGNNPDINANLILRKLKDR